VADGLNMPSAVSETGKRAHAPAAEWERREMRIGLRGDRSQMGQNEVEAAQEYDFSFSFSFLFYFLFSFIIILNPIWILNISFTFESIIQIHTLMLE
jgi:hypothetical protein